MGATFAKLPELLRRVGLSALRTGWAGASRLPRLSAVNFTKASLDDLTLAAHVCNVPPVFSCRVGRDRHRIQPDRRWHLARYYRDCVWHRSEAQYDLFLGLDAVELDPMVASSYLEYEISDRARLILVGVITAAICGIMIYASFVHLTV